jgi:Fe-S-cluster-containing hydrogenase component 2
MNSVLQVSTEDKVGLSPAAFGEPRPDRQEMPCRGDCRREEPDPCIDQEKCIKCGTCFEACPPRFNSVRKISGESVPPPIPEEARTIVRKSKTRR